MDVALRKQWPTADQDQRVSQAIDRDRVRLREFIRRTAEMHTRTFKSRFRFDKPLNRSHRHTGLQCRESLPFNLGYGAACHSLLRCTETGSEMRDFLMGVALILYGIFARAVLITTLVLCGTSEVARCRDEIEISLLRLGIEFVYVLEYGRDSSMDSTALQVATRLL